MMLNKESKQLSAMLVAGDEDKRRVAYHGVALAITRWLAGMMDIRDLEKANHYGKTVVYAINEVTLIDRDVLVALTLAYIKQRVDAFMCTGDDNRARPATFDDALHEHDAVSEADENMIDANIDTFNMAAGFTGMFIRKNIDLGD